MDARVAQSPSVKATYTTHTFGTETNEKRTILLIPTKDGTKWQYINLTKGYICPCQFYSREEALKDFVNYANKFFKVEFEEMKIEVPKKLKCRNKLKTISIFVNEWEIKQCRMLNTK